MEGWPKYVQARGPRYYIDGGGPYEQCGGAMDASGRCGRCGYRIETSGSCPRLVRVTVQEETRLANPKETTDAK